MRLPSETHTGRAWRIRELVPDFRIEDVWALPTPGGRDDFGRLIELFTSLDPAESASPVARTLFGLRWKIGALLGWDGPESSVGSRVVTLRDRLPADLATADDIPTFRALPVTGLYVTRDEFAAEIANRTMHGVMHLGWVPDEDGGYRGEMAVYVKPNGLFGSAYMAAIKPFRYVMYPLLMRQLARRWRVSQPSDS